MIRRASIVAALTVLVGTPGFLSAQTTARYHLHTEASTIHAAKQLKIAGPEPPSVVIQSTNFKGQIAGPTDYTIARFETQTLDPNLGGTIPAQSVVRFSVWMRKTAQYGVFRPRFTLFLNNYCCSDGLFVCQTSGYFDPTQPADLTQTLTQYVIECTTQSAVQMATFDRFFVDVDVYVVTPPGNHNIFCELGIEGVADGQYDSTVTVPLPQPPTITPPLVPNRGPNNTLVQINGTNFRDTQGSSTVKFNGTAATVNSWSATLITARVPLTATAGSELAVTATVSVAGADSGGAAFTVTPSPTIAGLNPPGAAVGQSVTINGSYFLADQQDGASTVTLNGVALSPTSWSDTAIVFTVPVSAATGLVAVSVSGNTSNSATFTLITKGTISGAVTRATGGTALSGAAVQAVLTGIVRGTATTAGDGTYAIPNLDPGAYDVRVTATGYSSEVRGGTTVSANVTTTANVTMYQPGSISGTVTQASGGAAIAGAAVAVYSGPMQQGSMATDANGNYSLANLHPGAYTVQAVNVGNRTKEQGATISENANTTANLALDPAGTGPVQYVYDELNRLVSVIDPSGDAAQYNYDKVGNILSIARSGGNTVSISEFTPNSGPVGSSVTIYGTGFSTSTANTVIFGSAQTTATATTPNQLTVAAPANPPGPVQISVGNTLGSATSSVMFTVAAAAAGAPTITGFSPAIWDGTSALTINGTNFDATPANDRVNLNLAFASPSAATASSLTVPVPSTAASGRISVATMAGTATSANDLYISPPGYSPVNLQSTGRVTLGATQTLSLSAGKFAMRLFDAVPGHRVSANFTNVTLSGSAAMYDPYGRLVHSSGLNWPSTPFLDAVTAVPGSYTLLVNASGAGDATFTVYDIVDKTGPITADGSSKTVTIDVAGQNALYSFSTTQTGRYSIVVGGNSLGGTVFLGDARGQPLGSTSIGIFNNLVEPVSLPAGNYTVGVDYGGPATGDEVINLWTVPDDVTGAITPTQTGSSVTADLTIPGRNALYTVSTPTNTRVALLVGAGPIGSVTVLNGATTVTSGSITAVSTFIEPWTFASGETIKVDPNGPAAGNVTLIAYDVPPDSTGAVSIGGAGVPVALSPGQNGTLTFTPSSNQSVTVHVTGNNVVPVTVSLLDSGGQTLASGSSSLIFPNFDLSSVNVAAGGTYTVRVDPGGASSGSLTISVSTP